MKEYFKIGKLAASVGLKGELILEHTLGKKTAFKDLTALFIEDKKDSFLPYFLQSAKIKNENETIVKLEGIDIMEAARKLTPKEVWLAEEDFKKFAAKSAPIALLGFTMMSNDEPLGIVTEVIEQPHQVLCTIIYKGKEALIPIHEESLVKVDSKNRKVFVTLPDGLLEIYE
jgi:16S rRNA processing protein RimM